MSSVEAAASLFGSDDPASDPFGTIGGNDDAANQSASQHSHSAHAPEADSLFPVDASASQQYASDHVQGPSLVDGYSSWPDLSANVNGHSVELQVHYPTTDPSPPHYQPQDQLGNGGQWANSQYDAGQAHPPYQADTHGPYATGTTQLSYDPPQSYAPQDTYHSFHAPDPQAQPYGADSSNTQHNHAQASQTGIASAYDPYIPAAPAAPHQSSTAGSVPETTYNAYAPSQYMPALHYDQAAASPSAYPAHSSHTSSAYNNSVSSAAQPPTPNAAQFRPKTYDAYDPPLPPPKPTKRAVPSVSSRSASPAVALQSHSARIPHVSSIGAPSFTNPVNPQSANNVHVYHAEPPRRSTPYQPGTAHSPYGPSQDQITAQYSPPPPSQYAPSLPTTYGLSQDEVAGQCSPRPTSHYGPSLPPAQQQVSDAPHMKAHPHDSAYSSYMPAHPGDVGHSEEETWDGVVSVLNTDPYAHGSDAGLLEGGARLEAVPPVLPSQTSVEEVAELLQSSVSFQGADTQDHANVDGYSPFVQPDCWTDGLETSTLPSQHEGMQNGLQLAAAPAVTPVGAGIEPGSATPRNIQSSGFSLPLGTGSSLPSAQLPSTSSEYSPYVPDTVTSVSAPQIFARAMSPSRAKSPPRAKSPGARSIGSMNSRPSSLATSLPTSSPMYDPYHPAGQSTEVKTSDSRVSSPTSVRSWQSPRVPAHDPYAPSTASVSAAGRDRSASNGSVYSISSVLQDPYAPQSRPRQISAEVPGRRHSHQSSSLKSSTGEPSPSQVLMVGGHMQTPYAPSPSLLGTNDSLARTSSRAPVISFGFGGKFVTCLHGSATLNTGFDVALSSRQTTCVEVRPLYTLIPESALDTSTTSYPGPLYCDPGATSSLVRAGTATQAKTNKVKVVKYLEERADELSRGIGYLNEGSPERRWTEGKLVLVKLLRVLVENDGHLSGSTQVESAIRSALVASLKDTGLSASADLLPAVSDYSYPTFGLSASDPNDAVLSTTSVRTSSLDKIQEFLLRGDRRNAYHHALDERLWAHAMVIASSVDKEAWKEVVAEFIKSELASKDDGTAKNASHNAGRESLRVAYSLFSGQGAASVQALVPIKSLQKLTDTLQLPQAAQVPQTPGFTPLSPNFPARTLTAAIPSESLAKWSETAAMMIPGPSTAECTAALTALGDCLLANQWVEAAHACYLLAPQSPVLAGIGSPSARVVLVGSRNPAATAHVDHDPIIFSEIVEFAMSLATPTKGQEPFTGLPNLQAYKLIRAASLAELGHLSAANRYCEAIAFSLTKGSTYPSTTFVEQLKELSERLVGAPDKSGSWIGGKMARPSLDSITGWLEGRLTKFIAGDGDASPGANQEISAEAEPKSGYVGPFSHYSTISSAVSSKASSPQPTTMNYHVLPGSQSQSNLPLRSGSAQALRPLGAPQFQIDRASSAMEYRSSQRTSSPVHRIASANAATSTFAQAGYGYNSGSYKPASYGNGLHPMSSIQDNSPSPNAMQTGFNTGHEQTVNGGSSQWGWGSSQTEESSTSTPTATTFYQVDQGSSPSTSGFISLMDDPVIGSPAMSSAATTPSPSTLATHEEQDDEEDLGFGNSSSKRATPNIDTAQSQTDTKDTSSPSASKPEASSSSTTSGWFSRWWKKDGAPGPVKATLGEESSFYYDKELKRWVNKKAGGEATTPAPLPAPPSRAQTASPGRSIPRMPNGTSPAPPPPARASSAIDLTSSPPRRSLTQPRQRSNLVPAEGENTTLSPSNTPPPQPGRPKSQASKRPVRSRYVDVFQQPSGGH